MIIHSTDPALAPPAQNSETTNESASGGCQQRFVLPSGSTVDVGKEGRKKFKVNQNSPMILHSSDGRLIQLSPDNASDLLPEVEIEFFQGEVAPPELVRQIWDVAKMNHPPSCETQNLQS